MYKTLILLVLVGSAIALKDDKDCDLREAAKKCIKSGFLLDSLDKDLKDQRFPKDVKDMNEMCGNVKSAETCVQEFINRCSDSTKEKTALDQSLEGAIRLIKRACKTETKKTEFIENVSKCGNEVLKDGVECLDEYKKVLFTAEKLDDKDKILKMMCCKIHDIAPCAEKRMKAKGEAICTQKNIDYMNKFDTAFKEEMVSVICADYERTSNKCKDFVTPRLDDVDVNSKSMLVVMKNIVDKVL